MDSATITNVAARAALETSEDAPLVVAVDGVDEELLPLVVVVLVSLFVLGVAVTTVEVLLLLVEFSHVPTRVSKYVDRTWSAPSIAISQSYHVNVYTRSTISAHSEQISLCCSLVRLSTEPDWRLMLVAFSQAVIESPISWKYGLTSELSHAATNVDVEDEDDEDAVDVVDVLEAVVAEEEAVTEVVDALLPLVLLVVFGQVPTRVSKYVERIWSAPSIAISQSYHVNVYTRSTISAHSEQISLCSSLVSDRADPD
jgi:hypothetical protein